MTFNVAAANCDDHTENFSFTLSEGGRWQLSPAYDITHAHAPESRWTRQHLMAVNGATTGITRADVEEVGRASPFLVSGRSSTRCLRWSPGGEPTPPIPASRTRLRAGLAATSKRGRRRCGEPRGRSSANHDRDAA